ncbi:aminotransferase class IV [Herbiconiux sp. VKM Ac-1786]|uniref:aminotransferase class IV n=1 Tax=Herbiconiux sp. VKM Ac-1786 TaxID=2783824 RepID=UPI001889E116|nr:aminotransferase class IV [Herbiconiux sp. VKM Ac-1786]MBF4571641.1 aminotransferase class IV [Herbiconiux sp. VKM Ac-1786]
MTEPTTVQNDDVVVFLAGGNGRASAPLVPVPQSDAAVNVADLAVTRGDGVFESIGVVGGRLIELPRHLARLAHSAELLELPPPDLAAFEAAAHTALAAHAPAPELLVKLFHSRGVETPAHTIDGPTGWVQVLEGADHTAARRDGVRVVLLDRGYRSDIAQTAPWLLQGAKTLSYALNKAALREAARRDADDVVFVSTDGVLLEGPTANVVVRHGDVFRTPRTDLGILAGTTQAAFFDTVRAQGLTAEEAVLTPDDLTTADAAWLCSSGRLLAPIRSLDGAPLPVDAHFTAHVLTQAFGLPT